ncbi:cupin domain-containing protein [Imbroritus primus]|uniref:cupin domain-containing protein n=1 Tax=Imbroritus primus TaxID=3058603 RepID=UPI003D161C88
MAMPHAAPGELIDLHPNGASLLETATQAFFKTDHLEVMRLVLLSGERFPEHQVAGEVTIQCLAGKVRLQLGARSVEMTAGTLLFLLGGTPHALEALEDAAILVTILLPAKQ